jgi:integrase
MSRATRWTDEKVRAFKLPPGAAEKRVLVDAGLYLHVRQKSGSAVSKHWQYRAQVDGKRRWLSLGEYPGVGLARVRAELLRHHAAHESAKKGEADHPVIAARNARNAAKAQPTVTEVFTEFLADKRLGSRRKGGNPVRERTIKILTENFDLDISARIGDAKIAMLTDSSIRECIDAPRRRGSPGAAAHVYRTLRGLVTFAIKRSYITGADPMRTIDNPRPYRPAPPNAASDDQLVALFKTVDGSALWPSTRMAIELHLLTGARPVELRLATWSEFNLKDASWTIPAEHAKMDRPLRLHLSSAALRVLSKAMTLRGMSAKEGDSSSDLVLPGAKNGPLDKATLAHALRRMAKRVEDAGGKRLRPNDLRKTMRTAMSRIGIEPHIAELCVAHLEKETMRRVYDGHSYEDEMADAWDRIGAHIDALRGGIGKLSPSAPKKPAGRRSK